MADPLDKIKPQVRRLSAYTLNAPETPVKINQNENPYDLPESIKQEVIARLADRPWSRYPAFVPDQLLETLAKFSNWQSNGILAGNGSNELIQALFTVTVQPGTKVILSEPTFTLYRLLIEVLGGEVVNVPPLENFKYNIEAIRDTAREKDVDLIVICSPNNPTGSRIDDNDLIKLLEEFPGLVVIDEAYHEFSGKSVVPLLKEARNLIVLRTFSKAMALAGLRIGYLLSSPELATEIAKAKLPYNINFFSQMAAIVAVEKFEEELRPVIHRLIEERERLFANLLTIKGLKPVPSEANFILTETEIPPAELFSRLVSAGILIRDVSRYPMLGRYTRISIGSVEENDLLIENLKKIFI